MKHVRRTSLVLCAVLCLAAGLLVLHPDAVSAVPPAPAAPAVPAPAAPAPVAPAPAQATPAPATPVVPAAAAPPPAPPSDPNSATIIIATTPPATATVHWGRKLLGRITPGKPLVVVRPRDSGPLDIMVRATGFLAVQTRAHTFSDSRVIVKLTTPENVGELLGYRAPVDAGVPSPEQAAALDAVAGPDAGVPMAPLAPGVPFQMVPTTPAPMLPLAPTQ